MAEAIRTVLVVLQWTILVYFLVVNAMLTVLLVSTAIELRRHRAETWHEPRSRLLGSEVTPTISIIAPAYNEEVTVTESVRSLLTLRYPNLEVVVVNDGSKDGTLERLREDFDLVPVHAAPIRRRLPTAAVRGVWLSRRTPALVVVDKENGGKADALNVGLDVASGELACAIDSDTLVEPDGLQRMVRPFLSGDAVIATGGTIRAVNGCEVRHGRVVRERAPRSALAALQAVEYQRAFMAGRLGWNRIGGNLVISGAFGLFRREQLIDAGGYEHETVGEDMEIVMRMRRRAREHGVGGTVLFTPDPVAWTEVPDTAKVLGRQRDRWHRGLADVLNRHRRMLANPRYGVLGLLVVPYFWIAELLAPVVELIGLLSLAAGLALGAIDLPFAILFMLVAYGWGLTLTVLTLVLEELTLRGYGAGRERLRLLGWAVVEGFGYRQLTAVWRLRGLWKWARGSTEWGSMTRAGFKR